MPVLILIGALAALRAPLLRPAMSHSVGRSRPLTMLRDEYDLIILGGGPVGVTAAVRAAALGHSAILVDATPRTQFQFTGPTGLFSKALRDAALRIDVGVLRSMGLGDAAIWSQARSQQSRSQQPRAAALPYPEAAVERHAPAPVWSLTRFCCTSGFARCSCVILGGRRRA